MREGSGAEFVLPSTSYTVDGTRIRSSRFPNGIVDPSHGLICLPGYSAAGESFARLWPLSGGYDVHLLTLPDVGWRRTDPIAAFAAMVEDFTHRFDRPVLLGTSFGGLVAIRAAASLGGRISGVILISTFASLHRAASVRLLPLVEPFAVHLPRLAARFTGGAALDDAARLELMREADGIERRERHARLVAAMACDLDDAARAITVPALILHGTADRLVPSSAARRLADLIPGADLHEIAGAGHLPFITHAEEVTALAAPLLRDCFHAHARVRMRAS